MHLIQVWGLKSLGCKSDIVDPSQPYKFGMILHDARKTGILFVKKNEK